MWLSNRVLLCADEDRILLRRFYYCCFFYHRRSRSLSPNWNNQTAAFNSASEDRRSSFKTSPDAIIQDNQSQTCSYWQYSGRLRSVKTSSCSEEIMQLSVKEKESCMCGSRFWSPESAGCLRTGAASAGSRRCHAGSAWPPPLVEQLEASWSWAGSPAGWMTQAAQSCFSFFCGTCPICWPWTWPQCCVS